MGGDGDRPLARPALPDEPAEIGTEIAAFERSLASTGWATAGGRGRGWVYALRDGRSDRQESRIYRRSGDYR